MKMLTHEREIEIRSGFEEFKWPTVVHELLNEIDRLRSENTLLSLSNDEIGYAQEARVYKRRFESLEKKLEIAVEALESIKSSPLRSHEMYFGLDYPWSFVDSILKKIQGENDGTT